MSHADLARTIEAAWEDRAGIGADTRGPVREAVEAALALLDSGEARVAEKSEGGDWHVNQWLKKAVLLSFRLNDMSLIEGGRAAAAGGTRCRRSSRAGTPRASAPPVSGRCRVRWCAGAPISRPVRC